MNSVIEVNRVSKKFCKDLNSTIKYGFTDIGKSVLGVKSSSKLRPQEFWALDDISFKLKRGETLGIIGPNGSGKSTLLKLLNGIFAPDKGTIKIKGKVGALIDVGAGFHPMLTGRENIYINGSILGMSKKEIDKKFDKIVNFADIGDFLDVPVKNYSSGMHVRLGFAIAIHANPDILLVDEVLAVGDYNFQRKCLDKMRENVEKDMSLILVTHSLHSLIGSVEKTLLLDKGKIMSFGRPKKIIDKYIENVNKKTSHYKHPLAFIRRGSGEARITKTSMFDKDGREIVKLPSGSPLKIKAFFRVNKPFDNPVFFFSIVDIVSGQTVLFCSSEERYRIKKVEKDGEFTFFFPNLKLGNRNYYLKGGILKRGQYDTPVDIWDNPGKQLFVSGEKKRINTGLDSLANSITYAPYEFKIDFK